MSKMSNRWAVEEVDKNNLRFSHNETNFDIIVIKISIKIFGHFEGF